MLFLLSSHSFFFFSYFTVIRYTSAADSTHSVVDASCTAPRLAVCPVGPMSDVPCTPVPTRTTRTATQIVAATTNDGSVCFESRRRRSIDWSEATNLPTWSPANLGPGEIRFRKTYCSHSLLLFFFADLEPRSVARMTKGHQQTWGQVSPRFEIRSTHIPLLLFFLQIREGQPSKQRRRATSRPGAR